MSYKYIINKIKLYLIKLKNFGNERICNFYNIKKWKMKYDFFIIQYLYTHKWHTSSLYGTCGILNFY